MDENCELVLHIYKDAEMSAYSLTRLLKDLKDKDNKIKKTIEDILKEYEQWKSNTKKYLKKHDAEISENGIMAKIMAGMGIDKEVNSDNSDSAIADMIIKGISTGTVDMEKKLKQYKDEANEKELELAEDFLKFQEKTIDTLKSYL